MVAVGASIQTAAAQRDAAEAPLTWSEAAGPPGRSAGPDGDAGADSLVSAQTHGEERWTTEEMKKKQTEKEAAGGTQTAPGLLRMSEDWEVSQVSHDLLNLPRVESRGVGVGW